MPSLRSPGLDELLDQQHRALSRSQGLDAGLSESAIRVRLDSGRWQQLYRRAYATYSGDPPRLAFLWAAVLSAGPDAVISHQTAAELYQLGRRTQRAIHVAVPEDRHIRRTYRLRPDAPPVTISRSDRIVRARHPPGQLADPPEDRDPALQLVRRDHPALRGGGRGRGRPGSAWLAWARASLLPRLPGRIVRDPGRTGVQDARGGSAASWGDAL